MIHNKYFNKNKKVKKKNQKIFINFFFYNANKINKI